MLLHLGRYWATDLAYIFLMDHVFDVFLDLDYEYFIEHFCINVHKRNFLRDLFLTRARSVAQFLPKYYSLQVFQEFHGCSIWAGIGPLIWPW